MTGRLLTAGQVAGRLQVPEATLADWRYRRRGPKYCKIGRLVRYREEDLEAWLTEGEQDSVGRIRHGA